VDSHLEGQAERAMLGEMIEDMIRRELSIEVIL